MRSLTQRGKAVNESRHIKIMCIPARMIEQLVREGAAVRCVHGVPVDAKLVRMHEDVLRDEFVLTFTHPSFPRVKLGTIPPIDEVVFEELSA